MNGSADGQTQNYTRYRLIAFLPKPVQRNKLWRATPDEPFESLYRLGFSGPTRFGPFLGLPFPVIG
jgi:hypothetical protein